VNINFLCRDLTQPGNRTLVYRLRGKRSNTLNGFDDPERNLTFFENGFPSFKSLISCLQFKWSKLSILFTNKYYASLATRNYFLTVPDCQTCMSKHGISFVFRPFQALCCCYKACVQNYGYFKNLKIVNTFWLFGFGVQYYYFDPINVSPITRHLVTRYGLLICRMHRRIWFEHLCSTIECALCSGALQNKKNAYTFILQNCPISFTVNKLHFF